jgi:hypothetical protein
MHKWLSVVGIGEDGLQGLNPVGLFKIYTASLYVINSGFINPDVTKHYYNDLIARNNIISSEVWGSSQCYRL